MTDNAIRQELVPLYEWSITVPVIWFEGRRYYPLRLLCGVLGVHAQFQLARIREHAVLSRLLHQFPVTTKTGRRDTWCIEERGIGFWLGSIQIASIRAEIQPRLLEFQEALVDAAHTLFTGQPVNDTARFVLALERRVGHLEEHVFVSDDEND